MKAYEFSITSQWGEDGVLAEIFKRIGIAHHICVDIGAWDGKHFSNTWRLSQHGWRRIMCEMNKDRADAAIIKDGDVMVVEKCESIDRLCRQEGVTTEYDLLSIDIDGDDYYLWQDSVFYKPRVVVIEYNQTVPPWMDIKQDRGGCFGASARSLMNLAEKKGYVLVHVTTTNLIFVLADYKDKFEEYWTFPPDWQSFVVVGYNGKKYMIGKEAHNDNQGGVHEHLITDLNVIPI